MIPDKYSRFLPFEGYTLRTILSEEEIIERLKIITRTTETIRFSSRNAVILRNNYDYHGEISGRSFELWRNINYRNSFRPIIKGRISTNLGKTEIRVLMNMSLPVKAFILVILSILLIVSIVTLIYFSMVIPAIVFAVICLAILLGFKLEASISKKDLNTILKAETE